MFHVQKRAGKAWLAPQGQGNTLAQELAAKGIKTRKHNDLFISSHSDAAQMHWTANNWSNLYHIEFDSIQDAAKALKSIQRNWWPYYTEIEPSRAKMIHQALPHISAKPIVFGDYKEFPNLGSFTLLSKNSALAASECSSVRPNGVFDFEEDKLGPPSRAYLKLWELFTRISMRPEKNQTCLELGASPGGWTWVLRKLGCKVFAFDRSVLDPKLMQDPNIEFFEKNAFLVDPKDYPEATWFFSDLICYPEKLLSYIHEKILPSQINHAVCTIKFQGFDHNPITNDFLKIKGSQLVHLYANKHELTWIWTR